MSEPEVWNIMTRTRDGVVSILRSLTEDQARQACRRLRTPYSSGDPWSDHAIMTQLRLREPDAHRPPFPYGSYGYGSDSKHDLVQVDCWGPPGVKLEVWPKPDDYDERFAKAEEAWRLAKEVNDKLKERA